MCENIAKEIYSDLLKSNGLPSNMSGDWESDKKEFMKQFLENEEILNSGLDSEDDFDEFYYEQY